MEVMTLSYSDADGSHIIELERPLTSIGRSADQDVVVRDACVSRRHAVILRDGDHYTVVDENSTHGTFVNATRIKRMTLKPSDVLQLGSLKGPRLQISLHHPGEPETISTSVTSILSSLIELRPIGSPAPIAREMEQLNWLLRAARQLNEGGAIDEILTALVQMTLQLTGLERGFVFLRHGDEMRLARGLGADGALLQEDSSVSRNAMDNAIASASKFSVSDTLADKQVAEWSSVVVNRIRCIYCIPLRKPPSAKGPSQLLGVLYLDSQIEPGHLTDVDEQLLGTIATEAAALVHNALLAEEEYEARKAREELAVAARIHSSLMSTALPVVPYAEIQARSVPCLAIGGDFYDAVALDDSLCVTVADVSGKGVSAAIVAATLQGIIHSQLIAGSSLPQIATLVNQFLCTRDVGKYATLIMLKLFPNGDVEYMNCGHVQPLSVLGTKVRRLEESSLVVGLIPGAKYASAHCAVRPGERILVVTDGLTEAEDPSGESFGEAGLIEIAKSMEVDEILDRIIRFQAPNPAQDDCTLLEIRYKEAR